ncbi:hypothetical protein PR048_032752 [Dryococelus australis]|uniref:Uncharacterized protein n=1 Tax=Dryococelus australis TaxID=614101 RepID=A0ABQ9G329_9NEOP|nr:hypothetical protein PR048_032752 [Dryococelus australis]
MDEDCPIAVAIALTLQTRRVKRSQLSKARYLEKNPLSRANLMKELRLEPCDWLNYLRMNEDAYLHLLSATLRCLAGGSTYRNPRFRTVISTRSLSKISPETCTRGLHKSVQCD